MGNPGAGIPHVAAPGVQQIRQSVLEKSLSLQAELAQQRPLSMVVPFGNSMEPGNIIVNQVADSLLQQASFEHLLTEKKSVSQPFY